MIILRGSLQTEQNQMRAKSVGYAPRASIGAGPTHGSSMSFCLIWGDGFGNDLDDNNGDSYGTDYAPQRPS